MKFYTRKDPGSVVFSLKAAKFFKYCLKHLNSADGQVKSLTIRENRINILLKSLTLKIVK
jgi:hypothetical protein